MNQPPTQPQHAPHTQLSANPDEIIIYYCPGMCGAIREDRLFSRGLYESGITDVRMFDWPYHWFALLNLRNQKEHRYAADRLVKMIRQTRKDQPEKRIILAGHSTGVQIALLALGDIEEGIVEQTWCLASAVSRYYDLRPMLKKTQRFVNLYSPWDWLMVKVGTTLVGTADGKRGRCAGAKSFMGPGSDDAKVEQLRFKHEWRKLGHHGGHTGPLAEAFAREFIGPNMVNYIPAGDTLNQG